MVSNFHFAWSRDSLLSFSHLLKNILDLICETTCTVGVVGSLPCIIYPYFFISYTKSANLDEMSRHSTIAANVFSVWINLSCLKAKTSTTTTSTAYAMIFSTASFTSTTTTVSIVLDISISITSIYGICLRNCELISISLLLFLATINSNSHFCDQSIRTNIS